MTHAIDILAVDDGILVATLKDLLGLVGDQAHTYHWILHDIQAVGDISALWPQGIVAFEEWVRAGDDGVELTWDELLELGELTEQIVNLRVEGIDPSGQAEKRISIEAIDSSLWRVEATDCELVERIKRQYRDVRTVV
jgi:hypothetical protein